MSKILIKAFSDFKRPQPEKDTSFLRISEFYMDTLQGENLMGYPAAFLRMQGCTLECDFCDSKSVWRQGNFYTQNELLNIMDNAGLVERFREGQHLVLTGGSPLKQQNQLSRLIELFMVRYKFKPYIEIENECTLMPTVQMMKLVDCWNNSPKLEFSGNPKGLRYQPAILKVLSGLENSWFKFVIGKDDDWDEVQSDFLDTKLIEKHQVVVMPLGVDRAELNKTREIATHLAIKHGVRFSDRLHITIWGKVTGV